MRNSLDNKSGSLFPGLIWPTVDWVAHEGGTLDLWQLRQLSDLVPHLDPVVGHEKNRQLDAWVETFQLFDLIVREPELLQGLADFIKSDDSLDVVSAEGKNF